MVLDRVGKGADLLGKRSLGKDLERDRWQMLVKGEVERGLEGEADALKMGLGFAVLLEAFYGCRWLRRDSSSDLGMVVAMCGVEQVLVEGDGAC